MEVSTEIVGLAPRQGQQRHRRANRDGTLCDMRCAPLAPGGIDAQKVNQAREIGAGLRYRHRVD